LADRERAQVCGDTVLELLLQVGDRDVAVAHRAGDEVKGLVCHLHVVAPHGRRRAQHGDVGGGYRSEIERCVIGALVGQLAATSGSGEKNTGEHGDDHDEEYNRHI
jgi:hypothetical protein